MTSEEITHDILEAFNRGEMPPEEALNRLIAAGVDADDARKLIRIANATDFARKLFPGGSDQAG